MNGCKGAVPYSDIRFMRSASVLPLPFASVHLEEGLPNEVPLRGLVHLPVVEIFEDHFDGAVEFHRVLDLLRSGVVGPKLVGEVSVELVDRVVAFGDPDTNRSAVRSHTSDCCAESLKLPENR